MQELQVSIFSIYFSVEANAKPIVGPCTIRQLLSQWCEISTPPRKSLIKVLAKFAKEPAEKEKLMELSDETKHVRFNLHSNWLIFLSNHIQNG